MFCSFPNLGIQCVKQKEVIDSLKKKKQMNIDPYQWFATSNISLDKCKPKSLDFEMNVVCICFQAFIPNPQNPNDFSTPLSPVVTHPIFDKSKCTWVFHIISIQLFCTVSDCIYDIFTLILIWVQRLSKVFLQIIYWPISTYSRGTFYCFNVSLDSSMAKHGLGCKSMC